jgi:uracil-DNA glycosylase
MSLTRDDMLRELELLPAWKLRTPIETVQVAEIEAKEIAKVEVVEFEKPSRAAEILYDITISQDKQWAFLCELSMPTGRMDAASQSMLFNNILHALSIEKPSKMQAKSIADIQVKMIVAMGEKVAQSLLNTQEPLESLRAKLHTIGAVKIIATYDLAHLLNNPLDKAKVWQDLCLARTYLQSLQTQD